MYGIIKIFLKPQNEIKVHRSVSFAPFHKLDKPTIVGELCEIKMGFRQVCLRTLATNISFTNMTKSSSTVHGCE